MRPPSSRSYTELRRLSDDQLMISLQAGSHDALAVLFDRFHGLVFAAVLKFVREPREAEQIMQDTFLDVFRARAQFDPSKWSALAWLLRHAYHCIISQRRRVDHPDTPRTRIELQTRN